LTSEIRWGKLNGNAVHQILTNCRISLPEYEPVVRMPDELWKAKSNTGRNVKKVLEIFKEKS